jgi:hypothetical protein
MLSAARVLALAALALSHIPGSAAARQQPTPDRTDAIRVFLDCRSCDENYIRTEITFVNYVRDRTAADVHVLIGGTEFTLKFIGLKRFAGVEQSLKYVAHQTNTSDETRRGLTAILRLGLVRYAAETPLASRLKVTYDVPKEKAQADVRDPWKFWIFRLGVSSNLQGEESSNEKSVDGFFSANRTTRDWKISLRTEADYSQEEFKLEEEETFTRLSRNIEADALVAKSLSEHWSIGGVGALQTSIFRNYDLRSRLAPGIEYDVFLYSESTRRILALLYTIGLETANYDEETIYGRISETLIDQRFETSLNLRQPWGNASASVEIAQYLTRTDKYRISAFGNLDVRLFKGLSLELFGEASRRRDQLSLRRGDATNEEILVRQRELATGYQYELDFGISYSFGSIFNNVVNPRFRNASGF